MRRLKLRVDLAAMIVMHINEVETGHFRVMALPHLGRMKHPEAFTATKVEDLRGWLLTEVMERGRVCRRQPTQ